MYTCIAGLKYGNIIVILYQGTPPGFQKMAQETPCIDLYKSPVLAYLLGPLIAMYFDHGVLVLPNLVAWTLAAPTEPVPPGFCAR